MYDPSGVNFPFPCTAEPNNVEAVFETTTSIVGTFSNLFVSGYFVSGDIYIDTVALSGKNSRLSRIYSVTTIN
jgi:hypothetical protein